jgi:hypothetical protein
VMLTFWSLWKQCNATAFGYATRQCSALELVSRIKELAQCNIARLSSFVGVSTTRIGE